MDSNNPLHRWEWLGGGEEIDHTALFAPVCPVIAHFGSCSGSRANRCWDQVGLTLRIARPSLLQGACQTEGLLIGIERALEIALCLQHAPDVPVTLSQRMLPLSVARFFLRQV